MNFLSCSTSRFYSQEFNGISLNGVFQLTKNIHIKLHTLLSEKLCRRGERILAFLTRRGNRLREGLAKVTQLVRGREVALWSPVSFFFM